MGSRVLSLKKPWVGHYHHATYSEYAWGVSILIHKSLVYDLLAVKIDPEGRYVLLHVVIDAVEMLILGLYIPPPATVSLLKYLTCLLSEFATDNIIIARDFKMLPNPSLEAVSWGRYGLCTIPAGISLWPEGCLEVEAPY